MDDETNTPAARPLTPEDQAEADAFLATMAALAVTVWERRRARAGREHHESAAGPSEDQARR